MTEFVAEGGWIEKRELLPGQLAVIVPNPEEQGSLETERPGVVYFHGLRVIEPTVFWTMGTKN